MLLSGRFQFFLWSVVHLVSFPDSWRLFSGLQLIGMRISFIFHNFFRSLPKSRHLHTRRNLSETGRQIHLPRKQCLINRRKTSIHGLRRHGQLLIGYRSYGNQTWPIKWNAVSSRQQSYRYFCMDALHGH